MLVLENNEKAIWNITIPYWLQAFFDELKSYDEPDYVSYGRAIAAATWMLSLQVALA